MTPRPVTRQKMQPDSVDRLQEALALVQCHGSPELIEWFVGLSWTHATDGKITDYRARKIRRDALLNVALAKIPGKSTWARCSQLAQRIRQFETRRWPRIRFMAEPPARFNELDQCLFHAFKLGIKMPDTAQGLVNATQTSCTRNLGNPDI